MKRNPSGIGVIGMGTIGSGLVRYLHKNKSDKYKLVMVAEKDRKKWHRSGIPQNILTDDYKLVIDDERIGTVVELIGGEEPALTIAKKTLNTGKNFITANKVLISSYGEELFRIAQRNNCYIGFRASIVGGHPIMSYLKNAYVSGKRIKRIFAVLNGTCNFILDEMEKSGVGFDVALKKAQGLGIAEPDPTLDIDGWDTLYKLKIIMHLTLGIAHKDKIYREGIKNIDPIDIIFAKEFGYRIKLLGMLEIIDRSVYASVLPVIIPEGKILAKLNGPQNGVEIEDEDGEMSGWIGAGAGVIPTRFAIMQDIKDAINGIPPFFPEKKQDEFKFGNNDNITSKFFLRFTARDKPGVLAQMSKILWKNRINISSVIQKGEGMGSGSYVPVIIITHLTKEGNVRKAYSEIRKLSCIDGRKANILRVIS